MINNHGNNGGGNPNHAEDGKFTSKENASIGKKEKTSEEKVLKQMGLNENELQEKYKPKFDHYSKRTMFLNEKGKPQVKFEDAIVGFEGYNQTFWEPESWDYKFGNHTMSVDEIMENQLQFFMSDEENEYYEGMKKSNQYDMNFLEKMFDKYLDRALDESSEKNKDQDWIDFITEDKLGPFDD